MVDPKVGFRLPLMHHLVQHRVLDLAPGMTSQVSATDGDLERFAGPNVHGELAQAGTHPAGEPNRDLAQNAVEVAGVQLPVQCGQLVQEDQVSRPRLLPGAWSGPRGRVRLDRERQELSFCGSAKHLRYSRIKKSNNCLQDSVRSKGVTAVDSQNPLAEAEHNRAIGMDDDAIDFPQAQGRQTLPQTFFERSKLTR